MPCYTDPPTQFEIEEAEQRMREKQLNEFTHNSPLAEIFCATMTEIESISDGLLRSGRLNFVLMARMPPTALQWWHDHKERDRKKNEAERKEREHKEAIQVAYDKLTPQERKLLGVKKPQI